MSLSVRDDVHLKRSKNARKPGRNRESLRAEQGTRRNYVSRKPNQVPNTIYHIHKEVTFRYPADPESQGTQDLFKKVRRILNELTPEKFNHLMKQVTNLTIDTEERLKGVVDQVFEKAINEPSLSVAYGKMCSCLATLKVPKTGQPGCTVSFIKLLLGRCKKEFENDKSDDVVIRMKQKKLDSAASVSDRHRLLLELQELKDIIRRRSMGNIKFIGDLFKLKMLTASAMNDCVDKLLNNHDEESLECLCSLLSTIGKDFDLVVAKRQMDQYFNQMENIVREGKTCTRIRHNWVSRKPSQLPNTIDHIHTEAKIEDQEEPRKVQKQLFSKETKRQPDPREQRDQRVQREEPGDTVPMTKNSRTTDPHKIPVPKFSKEVTFRLPADPESQGTQDLFKKVRRILNELTPEKFNHLMKQVTNLTIDTEERLKGVVDQVFEKAINEPILSVAYGKMCSCLATLKVPITSQPGCTVSFIKLLIGRCKKNFENDKSDDVVIRMKQKKLDSAASVSDCHRLLLELQELKDIIRRRSMGNIKFVSELFKLKMLTAPDMLDCVDKLLNNHDIESLECLCSLLSTIGKDFDLEEAKPWMDQYFNLMENIVREGRTCTRIRVMLQDIIDLRLHNWVSGKPSQVPNTIDISHTKANIEDQEEPRKVQKQLFSKETKRQPDPSEKRDQCVQREEPGDTVPMTKNSRTTDPHEIPVPKFTKPQVDEKIQLGPQPQVALVKASSEGAKASDSALQSSPSPQPSTTPQQNQDSDARRTLESRSSTRRKRGKRGKRCDKPLIYAPSQPDPLTRESSSQELLQSPTPEEHSVKHEKLDESLVFSSPFLMELMTAVCEAAAKGKLSTSRMDTAIIQKSLPVLLKYLNSDTEQQLHALQQLKALIITLDHPPNLLRIFFDCFYDGDVISKDAFYKFGTSKDQAEQLGKDVALKSVTAFFTWLREAEQESADI
ncbi:eukaryotic translation initiation factor 4 gamma 3-like [Platichthys flesus]|uniref:eukaryotic translation initiation factor 4 gamma 3-like n=1 Tax=Platichthys flesus TaxID=8260 RepID=UPI002DBB87A5|nr:eukaryotic translation initiation factor 4 gamma 3-like [Platichthys flesus]